MEWRRSGVPICWPVCRRHKEDAIFLSFVCLLSSPPPPRLPHLRATAWSTAPTQSILLTWYTVLPFPHFLLLAVLSVPCCHVATAVGFTAARRWSSRGHHPPPREQRQQPRCPLRGGRCPILPRRGDRRQRQGHGGPDAGHPCGWGHGPQWRRVAPPVLVPPAACRRRRFWWRARWRRRRPPNEHVGVDA